MFVQIGKQPWSLFFIVLATLLAGCSTNLEDVSSKSQAAGPKSSQSKPIQIDGSSTVFPLTEAVADKLRFQEGEDAPKITVDISGTTGGFKKFCTGASDINNASRPILKAEMESCKANGVKYVEIPVAFDALTIVVHPKNKWADSISVAELKTMWEPNAQGKIVRWNQVRDEWPDEPLELHGADVESGTYDYFTEAIVGEANSSRKDYEAQEDDNLIVQAVSESPNALGYFGYAYYNENNQKLKALAIDNGNGPILPSDDTVRSGEYRPLTRPLFVYVSTDAVDNNPALSAFIDFYLKQARFMAKGLGYTPLPNEAYNLASKHMTDRRIGTVFDGEPPTDLSIEALVQAEREF